MSNDAPGTVFRIALAACLLLGLQSASAAICRVAVTGNAAADGSSWANAKTLQSALSDATACSELWVAGGVYTPHATDVNAVFSILPGVQVYGGFAGSETSRDQRDWVANRSILSGDLAGDDLDDDGNHVAECTDTGLEMKGSNSLRLVLMDGTTAAGTIGNDTVLDGFTLTAAKGAQKGAGIYCNGSGSGHECSPTLRHLRFSGLFAQYGAGLYNDGSNAGKSSPILNQVTFTGMLANHDGGAIYDEALDGEVSPTIDQSVFYAPTVAHCAATNNAAQYGAAILVNFGNDVATSIGSLLISNTTFQGNRGIGFASGPPVIAVSGGAAMEGYSWDLRNVTITGNNATQEYMIYVYPPGACRSPRPCGLQISNLISWDNNGLLLVPGAFGTVFINSVLAEGCSSEHCTNVSSADPLLGTLITDAGDLPFFLPGSGSSAVNAGDDATCAAAPVNGRDQLGLARPQGAHCDIGAVELSSDVIFRDGFE